MLKPIIAGITALSLTITAPAQAVALDRDNVGKLLLGLAAIAALSAAAEHNKNEQTRNTRRVHDRSNHDLQSNNRRGNRWSQLNRDTNQRVVPHACLRRVETRFGTQRMFGRRCLERNYRHVDSLPARCAVRVYSNNGPRRGFDPQCLREQGYRSDRRR